MAVLILCYLMSLDVPYTDKRRCSTYITIGMLILISVNISTILLASQSNKSMSVNIIHTDKRRCSTYITIGMLILISMKISTIHLESQSNQYLYVYVILISIRISCLTPQTHGSPCSLSPFCSGHQVPGIIRAIRHLHGAMAHPVDFTKEFCIFGVCADDCHVFTSHDIQGAESNR